MALQGKFDTTKFFVVLILLFIVMQVGSVLYTNYYGGEPLKLGWAFFLLLFASAIISVFTLGRKLSQLTKYDIFFIVAEFLAIILIIYYLPKYVPQAFSSIKESYSVIKNIMASIVQAS